MTHLEHVALAWRLLNERPFAAAFAEIEARLTAMAAAAGKPNQYDRRLTLAYLQLIAGRLVEGEGWEEFAAGNSDLLTRRAERIAHSLLAAQAEP
jgi:hypothetical protein